MQARRRGGGDLTEAAGQCQGGKLSRSQCRCCEGGGGGKGRGGCERADEEGGGRGTGMGRKGGEEAGEI
eukprot:767481-Hanusia_phi.AAC.2